MQVPVLAAEAPFRAAISELPLRAVTAREPGGAVVVASTVDAAVAAVESGAVGLVIDSEGLDDLVVLDAFVDSTSGGSGAPSVPVAVVRPGVRPDHVDLVRGLEQGVRARPVLVEAAAEASEMSRVAADALGWARVLAGGELRPRSAACTPAAVLAQFDGPQGEAVSLVLTASSGRARGSSLRAEALGDPIVRVVNEGRGMAVSVSVQDADGTRCLPPRWESRERLAVRRVITAITRRESLPDLGLLRSDLAARAAIRLPVR